MSIRIAVSGGGTGGHIIPALNIADVFRAADIHNHVIFIGNGNGSLEEKLAHEHNYPFYPVKISPFSRTQMLNNAKLPFEIIRSLVNVNSYLRREKINLVVGTGGYASLPAVAGARFMGMPYFLQDQNAFPGMVTRQMASGARRIFLGYAEAKRALDCRADRLIVTGNPVSIERVTESPETCRERFGLLHDRKTLFVTGGSGGALSINKVVDSIKSTLMESGWNIIWQTGKHWDGSLDVAVEDSNKLVIKRFLTTTEMGRAYRSASVAVARCGAMSLAELAAYSLPAVLIPFPFSTDGHQEANGRAVEIAGGGKLLLDKELSPESLTANLNAVYTEREGMATCMGSTAVGNAAEKIYQEIRRAVNV